MKGIKMSDCRFYVNEAERTVVCVIPQSVEEGNWRKFTSDMVLDFIYDNFSSREVDFHYAMDRAFEDELKMPSTFMGKAVCAPDDEWNEETGKLIAYSRAKNKFYKSFFRRANKYVQTMDSHLMKIVDTFNDFGERIGDNDKKLEEQIKEMVK
jgi:hypothetical protein